MPVVSIFTHFCEHEKNEVFKYMSATWAEFERPEPADVVIAMCRNPLLPDLGGRELDPGIECEREIDEFGVGIPCN